MAAEEELEALDSGGENSILREAMEALRQGDKKRARDLLTRLLKADQNNANYWLWLSAVVETTKERLYCLRTALNLEPENPVARRGLTLLGALPPDDAIPPFPVDRPRSWEDKLVVRKESQESKRGWANPLTRVFIVLGVAAGVILLAIGGWSLLPRGAGPIFVFPTQLMRASRTSRFTPSATPLYRTATPTFPGATPLSELLAATYTASPRYILTEHPIISRSAFESGLRFLAAGDYENALVLFDQALSLEEDAPDIHYYIGEVHRAQEDYRTARDSYQEAINLDPSFAPAFLGRARVNFAMNPELEVLPDLDTAISLDPGFTEAYLERAVYLLPSDPNGAIADLETALELSPDSALVHLQLSRALYAVGQPEQAVEAALRANQIDSTLLPVYLALGRAWLATGAYQEAVGALQAYVLYEPNHVDALLLLGTAYNGLGQSDLAVDVLSRAITADRRNGEALAQRGYAYLNQQRETLAVDDFKFAIAYLPASFQAQLGLARAYYQQGKAGDAYIQAEKKAYPLVETTSERAEAYYWMAVFLTEIGDELSLVAARNYWYSLIALPAASMPDEYRQMAFERLGITPTVTRTVAPTRIPSHTPTLPVNP